MKNNTKDLTFEVYRYNPEQDSKPRMQSYTLHDVPGDAMLLEALKRIKEQDPSLSFRHSCGEGVCGSDAMSINGQNGLSCITPLHTLTFPARLAPLPGLPVIRDLVVDMEPFYRQYRDMKPWLQRQEPEQELEYRQSPAERSRLDGLYECILCACCSASCPSYWWNPDKFAGPAALLQAARFIEDSRDQAYNERLQQLDDVYRLFRCHSIMNCVQSCPKKLNPTAAIGRIKQRMMQ